MYPYLHVLGRDIGTYSVMGILGLLTVGIVISALAGKRGISYLDIILAIVSAALGMLAGGSVFYAATNYELIVQAFSGIGTLTFMQWCSLIFEAFSGMVFYGGFAGGAAGIAIFTKTQKQLNAADMFDLYAVAVPLFHVFGRLGCFFGGCCYGIESSFGFIVYDNTINPAINGVRRFPVQLAEALCNLLLFFVLMAIYKKTKTSGRLIFIYMMIYPIYRFFLEFLRGDEIRRHWFAGLSTSQIISIAVFAAGAAGFLIRTGSNRRKNIPRPEIEPPGR